MNSRRERLFKKQSKTALQTFKFLLQKNTTTTEYIRIRKKYGNTSDPDSLQEIQGKIKYQWLLAVRYCIEYRIEKEKETETKEKKRAPSRRQRNKIR
jgi:hypothetical protein